MAMKLINETSLVAIGDAIRAKNGSSDTYSPAEMATAISNISGGGQTVEVVPSIFTTFNDMRGDYLFTGQIGKKLLNNYLNQITFTDMEDMPYAFAELQTGGDNIYPTQNIQGYPTDLSSLHIYFKDNSNNAASYGGYINIQSMFENAHKIQLIPNFHFTNTGVYNCSRMFYNAQSIINVDDFMNNLIFLQTTQGVCNGMFYNAHLIKHIPHLEKLKPIITTNSNYSNKTVYSDGFGYCYELQELLNLPVWSPTTAPTGNFFYNSFDQCSSLGRFVFEMNNGQPIVANWKKQTVNLTNYIGYFQRISYVKDTTIPVVIDAATYNQYKNDMYHTASLSYSRYNHTSAVETINSLPDCSATAGTSGNDMNTIKFKSGSGADTDGGDIANLTSQEIAVATAKGWNVVIV